ncbi:MAG: hypothetical protein OXG80_08785 [Chloroflexi bacterium]|nr:hypothetical protein [Chloroflexota bacterium]
MTGTMPITSPHGRISATGRDTQASQSCLDITEAGCVGSPQAS